MNSDFLFRLLTTQAWQIAVLAFIVLVAVRLLASRRPRLAHCLWLIVVIKCVTPPLWGHSLGLFSQMQSLRSWMSPSRALPTPQFSELTTSFDRRRTDFVATDLVLLPGHKPLDLPLSAPAAAEAFGLSVGESPEPKARSVIPTVVCWILVTGLFGSFLALSFRFISCLRRIQRYRTTEFDDEIHSQITELSAQLKLRRVPRFIVADVRFGPAVLGIFRHLIVLPKCIVAEQVDSERSSDGLRPILAHELLHIRRGDLWTGTLQAVVQCLWWFHPAVWIVNRLLSRETERCCDEQVIAELGCSPLEYARSLLAVIECKHRLNPVPVFPGMKPVEITSQRMERIMSLTQGSRPRMSLWSFVAVLLFAVVVLPGAATGQPSNEAEKLIEKQDSKLSFKELTGDTVVALVNGQEIRVDDMAENKRLYLEAESDLPQDEQEQALLSHLEKVLPRYIEQEIVLQHYHPATTGEQRAKAQNSLEVPFRAVIAQIKKDWNFETDEELNQFLAQKGLSVALLRNDFFRLQLTQGFVSTLLKSPDSLEARRTLIKELQDAAVVTTIFEKPSFAEKSSEMNDGNGFPEAEARSGRITFGAGVNSDAGVAGQVVLDKRYVQVVGAVRTPGTYDIPAGKSITLVAAIARAGGLSNNADDRVVLRRPLASGGSSVVLVSLNEAKHDRNSNLFVGPGDVIVVGQVAQPKDLSPTEKKMQEDLNQLVSLSFENKPLNEVLRQIATDYGVNIAVDTSSFGSRHVPEKITVTVSLEQVTLRTALGDICGLLGLEFEAEHEVVKIRKQKAEPRRFTARVYPVVDLVVPVPIAVKPFDASIGEGPSSVLQPQPPTAITKTNAASADFTGLVELIKTTVEPDSWGEHGGQIEPNRKTLSLIVRQTSDVHEKIIDLMQQLRALQDRQTTTKCEVLQFDTAEQIKWLNQNVDFHMGHADHPWALLPKSGTRQVLNDAKRHATLLSAPTLTTFAGQSASIKHAISPDFKFALQLTGVPVEGNKLIRLKYGVSIRSADDDLPATFDRIVGNGQTLLLDVSSANHGAANHGAANDLKADVLAETNTPRIVVAITPTIVLVKDEAELILNHYGAE